MASAVTEKGGRMMTCKDCIHYDVCQFHIDEETKMTVNECEKFKNKADFVEVTKVVEMLCKIKTNTINNASIMIENAFIEIVKDALGERSDTNG